jgi:hypothetical protein
MSELVSPVKAYKDLGYRYVTIFSDGSSESSVHDKRPDWKEIQQHVGGTFQIVPYFSSLDYNGRKLQRGTAYCNENGYVYGMPHNETATRAWMKACPKGDPKRMRISGPLLFVAKEKEAPNGKAS